MKECLPPPCVTCQVSGVTCQVSSVYIFIYFLHRDGASLWRLHYQQSLPRLVCLSITISSVIIEPQFFVQLVISSRKSINPSHHFDNARCGHIVLTKKRTTHWSQNIIQKHHSRHNPLAANKLPFISTTKICYQSLCLLRKFYS